MYLKNQSFGAVLEFCNIVINSRFRHQNWTFTKENRRLYFHKGKTLMEIYNSNENSWNTTDKVYFPNPDELFSYEWEIFDDDLNLKDAIISNRKEVMHQREITPEPPRTEVLKHRERFEKKIKTFQDEECILCCHIIGRKEYKTMGTSIICGECYYDSGGYG